MSQTADHFFAQAKLWHAEMTLLRSVILETKLEETIKWGKPCYAADGNNIAIIQPFKGFLALMFFKGMLLKDAKKLLVPNGPNSQSASRLEYRSKEEIAKQRLTIKSYLKEAVKIENSGEKVKLKKQPQAVPAELTQMFAKRPKLKAAFDSLTPGRQRAYLLHFGGAKQSATRMSRIEKCLPDILAGKGWNER